MNRPCSVTAAVCRTSACRCCGIAFAAGCDRVPVAACCRIEGRRRFGLEGAVGRVLGIRAVPSAVEVRSEVGPVVVPIVDEEGDAGVSDELRGDEASRSTCPLARKTVASSRATPMTPLPCTRPDRGPLPPAGAQLGFLVQRRRPIPWPQVRRDRLHAGANASGALGRITCASTWPVVGRANRWQIRHWAFLPFAAGGRDLAGEDESRRGHARHERRAASCASLSAAATLLARPPGVRCRRLRRWSSSPWRIGLGEHFNDGVRLQ